MCAILVKLLPRISDHSQSNLGACTDKVTCKREEWTSHVCASEKLMAYLGSMETAETDLAETSPANEDESFA